MPILNIQTSQVGLIGTTPSPVYIDTNDTVATVTTAGYLNNAKSEGFSFSNLNMALVSTRTTPSATPSVGWYEVSVSGSTVSLVAAGNPGTVVLPTIANHIATFTNTAGTLSEDPATAISAGNIQAGLSGTAGSLISFPATAANGSLIISAVANVGNHTSTLSSVAGLGQNTAYTLPDPGVVAASVILTQSAGTQTIATGGLTLSAGNIISTTGNVIAGSSGHAGTVSSFPGTAARGSMRLQAADAGGAFDTVITNAAMGQNTALTVPDPGAASANFVLDAGPSSSLVYQQMIPLEETLIKPAGGTFTIASGTQGVWSYLHSTAADTTELGFDITQALRTAAGKGFELSSFDVIYAIGTAAILAHTLTLSSTVYANNLAPAVTNVAITGALATATQAQPYLTNVTVNAPAFSNPSAATSVKQVIELTVQADTTSVYNLYGINLRFTRTVA